MLIRQKGIRFTRKTTLGHSFKDTPNEVILLDTIGELSKRYSIGTFIFVGGSLVPIGGHNALEPAVFKKAVLFGPHMGNFAEIAKILLKNKGALQVHNEEEFIQNALRLLRDNDFRERLGSSAFHVVEKHCGAVKKSMEVMKPILEKSESPVIQSAASA